MNAFIQIAGLTLLHFVWQGTMLALVAAAALRFLRDASPQSRYVAACIVLAAMLAAPVATIQVLSAPAPVDIVIRDSRKTPTIGAAPATVTDAGTTAPEPHERPTPNLIRGMLPFVVGIWAAGVVLLLGRLAGGWWRVRSRHRAALGMAVSRWQASVAPIAAILRVRRRVLCFDSPLVDTPTVIGWLKPVILLPIAALATLTPAQVEAILAHELAHVRRHDYIVNLLQNVAETLLFYHPAVWWVSKRIRAEREHCCDEIAVKIHGDAVGYVAALAELEAWRTKAPPLAVAATGGSLLDRVHRLLRVPDDGESPASSALLTAALILVIVVAGGSRYFPAARADAGTSPMLVQAAPRTNWQTYETPHFDVLYPQGSNVDVERIEREAERAYDRNWLDLGHDLSFRPYLVVFGTRRELEQGVGGADFPQDRNRILLSLDAGKRVGSELRHEVAHSFFFDIVPRQAIATLPSWISEGLAEYMRGDWSASDREALSDLVRRDSVPQVSRLTSSSFSDSPRLNYVIGHAAFDFIVSRWNTDGLRRFLLSLRQQPSSGNLDDALRSMFGLEPEVFDRDFERYVTARFAAPPAAGAAHPPDVLLARFRLEATARRLRARATELEAVQASTPNTPTFEVASLRRNKGDDPASIIRNLPDSFNGTNVTLRFLIRLAFRLQDSQILGGPGWLNSERFDVVAKTNGAPNADRLAAMMRALLEDRFKLKAHKEARDVPIFALVLARSDGRLGPQLRPTNCGRENATSPGTVPAQPCRSATGAFGRLNARAMPLSELATMLSPVLNRVVVDRTDLTGNFDFDLEWTPDQLPGPARDLAGGPPVDPNGPPISSAVQEQLGLKLDAQRQSTDVLVIDSAEPPTEN